MSMKDTTTEEWSDFQVTLASKMLDTLGVIVHKHERKQVSTIEVLTACDALIDSTSGLAPWDVIDTIEAVKTEVRRHA